MAQSRIAVVGAGLAGVAAALELKALGHTVELFERSRLLGGKATSFEIEGIEVDNGQHVFWRVAMSSSPLSRALGFQSVMMRPCDHRCICNLVSKHCCCRGITRLCGYERSISPAPLHLSMALLKSRQLGWMGRLQVGLALLFLGTNQLPGETFDSWLRRYGQGEAARRGFWEPFVVPALNAGLDEVTAQAAAFVIRTAFLEDRDTGRFGYTRVPLGRIANMVTPQLDRVRLRTPVLGITEADGRLRVELQDESEPFDGVVLAVPPERLKSILKQPKVFGVFGLDQFRTAPIVDIHLWYELSPGSLFGDGLAFAALLDSPIQWIFEKPAPSGETYLCCSMSAAHRYVGVKSADLVDLATRELATVLPQLKDVKPLRGTATRDREATFIPSVGLIRPGPETSSKRVVIAGAWTNTGWPATMESAVRSGKKRPRSCMAQLLPETSGADPALQAAVQWLVQMDAILREAWEGRRSLLTGVSAGAICWFEACITDSFGEHRRACHDGLGFLAREPMCPHYDSGPNRRPVFQRGLVGEGFPAGYAAEDDVGLHFVGTELHAAVVAARGRPAPSASSATARPSSA